MENDLQKQIDLLRKDLDDLNNEFYRNNFSAQQDFNKKCNFTTRLKVPHYAATPATCEVGELIEVSGILYVGSAADTWTKVGVQV